MKYGNQIIKDFILNSHQMDEKMHEKINVREVKTSSWRFGKDHNN